LPIASAALSRRVEKVVGYPPLSELSDLQLRVSAADSGGAFPIG
jgi:hypothetical protein